MLSSDGMWPYGSGGGWIILLSSEVSEEGTLTDRADGSSGAGFMNEGHIECMVSI